MTGGLPDTTGYPLERALELLEEAGAGPVTVSWVGPPHSEGDRAFVLRQRPGDEGPELTVSAVWRTPFPPDEGR